MRRTEDCTLPPLEIRARQLQPQLQTQLQIQLQSEIQLDEGTYRYPRSSIRLNYPSQGYHGAIKDKSLGFLSRGSTGTWLTTRDPCGGAWRSGSSSG